MCDCRNTPGCGRKSDMLSKYLTQLPFLAKTLSWGTQTTCMGHDGKRRQTLSWSLSGYSSRNRRQLSLVCRQLIIGHPQPTFNYTGIQSDRQAADTFIPVSVIGKAGNITMLLWSHNTLKHTVLLSATTRLYVLYHSKTNMYMYTYNHLPWLETCCN